LRGLNHTVTLQIPQYDEIKTHISKHQFLYGVVTGIVIAKLLSHR
jgi:hypothetical protein